MEYKHLIQRTALYKRYKSIVTENICYLSLLAILSIISAQAEAADNSLILRNLHEPSPQVDEMSDSVPQYGVEIHTDRDPFVLPNVSGGNYCACMAIAQRHSNGERQDFAIISVGGPPMAVKRPIPLKNIGKDPEDCVLVVNLDTSKFERIKYHHRRPDQIVTSPDGRFVGMASSEGWTPPGELLSRYSSPKNEIATMAEGTEPGSAVESDRLARKEKADRGMQALCVGTMKVSVWETAPFRPLWELRYAKPPANQTQQFSRPWNSYARVELPWWEENVNQQQFGRLRIGFSNCSQYFVSLDESQNVTILRLADGKAFHCCPATKDVQPAAFFFDAEPGVVSVICTDHRIRQFLLETGNEVTNRHLTLPWCARFLRDSNNVLGMEFVVDPSTGTIATLMPHRTLQILQGNTLTDRWKKAVDVTNLTDTKIRRLDCTLNSDRLGVGYVPGYGDCRFRQHSDIYELIDLKSAKVLKRIVSGTLVNARLSSKAGHHYGSDIDIITPRHFASCLSPDGRDIFYAFSVDDSR
ncbi:hypothetical protein [Schlesneria sp. DSM 10557]|uniref:hypothetical protein n=1 Tax=Schlesneria sp. DSM 10557 TaxID=3044399 RepID=UPI00359FB72E